MRFSKILGTLNPADVFIKYLSRELMRQHVDTMKCEHRDGRAEGMVKLHTIQRKMRQLKYEIKERRSRELCANKLAVQDDATDSFMKNDSFVNSLINKNDGNEADFFNKWHRRQGSERDKMRKILNLKSKGTCIGKRLPL